METVQVYFYTLALFMLVCGAVFGLAIISWLTDNKMLPENLQGWKVSRLKKCGFWVMAEGITFAVYSMAVLHYWTLEKIQAADRGLATQLILSLLTLLLCAMLAQAIGWMASTAIMRRHLPKRRLSAQ